jgi:predicted phosphoadenosine phosphosulfate sulfurtransferase
MEHYGINGTTIITFSGGRTSGFLLHKILENYNGKLPSDAYVVFDNTGKEMKLPLKTENLLKK